MPYIDRKTRRVVDQKIDEAEFLTDVFPESEGELNYIITVLCLSYLNRHLDHKPPRYSDYNATIGVLECAKLELYARRVRPYEDLKIIENGDV